jgi:hypothetical protein
MDGLGAGIVGSVLDLVCGGERLHLRVREARAAGIGQIAESDQFERVAVGTNLLIDLKTALKLRLVITAKRTAERPFLARRLWLLMRVSAGVRPGIARGKNFGSARR